MPGVELYGNPYPLVRDVMNLARVRVNDAANDLTGDLLTDTAPYSQTIFDSAWRWLQGRAYTAGIETPIREEIIYALPMQSDNDPAHQAHVTWMGCSDGVMQMEAPALPRDLIQPLTVWRKESGSTSAFSLMRQAEDGLPVYLDYNVYDWRADGLYFYANTYTQDLRLRYAAFHPNLDITNPTLQVPMMMCEDCLSARIAFEFASLRGAAGTAQMDALAKEAFETIAQRTSRRKQRQTITRKRYNGGSFRNRWPVP